MKVLHARGLCSCCYQRAADQRAQASEHYKQNRARHYDKHLRNTYGISLADAELLLSGQGGCCAICTRPLPPLHERSGRKSVCLDHCHATGTVRGVLCHLCNKGLGMLGDSPTLLRHAAQYLERHTGGKTNG